MSITQTKFIIKTLFILFFCCCCAQIEQVLRLFKRYKTFILLLNLLVIINSEEQINCLSNIMGK